MANIRDVSKEAGVSISTVSRVIQGSPKVLPETRSRVEEAIRKLDFHPNRLAQQFRIQQTNNILVIVPELGNAFYSQIISGIEAVARKNGFSTLIIDSHSDPSIETKCYDMLSQRMIDGIITFSISLPKEKLKELVRKYPIVIGCRYFSDDTLPVVTIDNIQATKDIVNYMLNLGHQKICYLAGPEDILLYQDRVEGYVSALRDRSLTVDRNLIIPCEASIEGGYNAVLSIMNEPDLSFTAIVASGDTMAIGAILALQSKGLKVPDDIAVSGFDDIEVSSIYNPPLTTVRQPKSLIGSRSAEKLMDLISGKGSLSYREILNHELVIRTSSGPFIGG